MKNLTLISSIVLLLALCNFTSCKKDKEDATKENEKRIIGTWVADDVFNTTNVTDDKFVCSYSADKLQMYANGYSLDNGGKSWIENKSFVYHFEDDRLIIEGTRVNGSSCYYESSIVFLDDLTIQCTDLKIIYDGKEVDEKWNYTMKKVQTDIKPQILGTWKCSDDSFYYTCNLDGTYDYYYKEEDGSWNIDKNGTYFLYGNYFVSNWILRTNGLPSFESWIVSFPQADSMTWIGNRGEAEVDLVTINLVKSDPPVVE